MGDEFVDLASLLVKKNDAFSAIVIVEKHEGNETVQSTGYDVNFRGVEDEFGVTPDNEPTVSLAAVGGSLCRALVSVAEEMGVSPTQFMEVYLATEKAGRDD